MCPILSSGVLLTGWSAGQPSEHLSCNGKWFRLIINMKDSSKAWAEIEPRFRGHIITTLRPDGNFMDNEEILSKIMADLGTT